MVNEIHRADSIAGGVLLSRTEYYFHDPLQSLLVSGYFGSGFGHLYQFGDSLSGLFSPDFRRFELGVNRTGHRFRFCQRLGHTASDEFVVFLPRFWIDGRRIAIAQNWEDRVLTRAIAAS